MKRRKGASQRGGNRFDHNGLELPQSVYKTRGVGGKAKPYKAEFSITVNNQKRRINVGVFSTPEIALAALNKRRSEILADPDLACLPHPKPDRGLAFGVYHQKANKTNPFRSEFTFNKKRVHVGVFPNPESALVALNKKKSEYSNGYFVERQSNLMQEHHDLEEQYDFELEPIGVIMG